MAIEDGTGKLTDSAVINQVTVELFADPPEQMHVRSTKLASISKTEMALTPPNAGTLEPISAPIEDVGEEKVSIPHSIAHAFPMMTSKRCSAKP